MNRFLAAADWRARRDAHHARLLPFVEEHRARRSRGEKHAVWDFLWEYYSFRPAQLLKWSPGLNVELEAKPADLEHKEFSASPKGARLDIAKFPLHRRQGVGDILNLLEQTAARPAFHGCFGLHEWAMVYRGETRHPIPLRLSDDAIAELVETQGVRCSHYDAFRFFTPRARPLNLLQPGSGDKAAHEQPGCIHANMDLYKFAYKFAPWIAADLIADCFELTREARWLDMRAAPYDMHELGVEPIRIETASGRADYTIAQRQIAARAVPLRARLIAAYRELANVVEQAL